MATISMNEGFLTPSDLGHTLMAFLRFEIFITPSALIITYWLGALALPLLAVLFMRKLLQNLTLPDISDLPGWQRSKIILIAVGLAMLVFIELMWRMAIETVLAYFQIHAALVGVSAEI